MNLAPAVRTAQRPKRAGLLAAVIAAASMAGALLLPATVTATATATADGTAAGTALGNASPPVLAYYYMWFNAASWTRAKNDLPSLGPYASTDPTVIAQHVTWARAAGVNAFIASWKNTPALDSALAELVAECRRQGLKLVLIYEGLDVNRNPIPVSTVGADMAWFLDHYGSDPVFDLYGKPAVIWSGSWRFTDAQISGVRSQIGAPDRVLLLGSEKDAASYQARAGMFDGDAYYWSSADPLATPGYQRRLDDLAATVHAGHGLWLAPASVGFDGLLNGGTTVVDRRNGATLTAAWNDAMSTSPDGIAVISWNEFTEASYVEPSVNYGLRYLQVLARLTGAPGPAGLPGSPASSGPPVAPSASPSPVAASASPAAASSRSPAGPVPGGPNYGASIGRGSAPYEGWASLAVASLVIAALVLLGINFRLRARAASGAGSAPDADGRSNG